MAIASSRLNRAFDRAKTAISRNNFSKPVRHLLEAGLLNKSRSFFDYGCGRGDDVAGLSELGFKASGWDPEYAPRTSKEASDVVNLGFVLNVIEDPTERKQTLLAAWDLTNRALIVTVISTWEQPRVGLSAFSDGAVTQRGTFQKYFDPGELKGYVDGCLCVESLPVSPVSVLCFKDPDFEQEYLAGGAGSYVRYLPGPTHPLRKTRLLQLVEELEASQPERWREILEWSTWHAMAPPESMIAEVDSLCRAGVHAGDVLRAIVEGFGETEWSRIVGMTRNRYLSQIALGFFRGHPRARHFGAVDRRAIRLHFGSFDEAVRQGRQTLFDIGDAKKVEGACAEAGFGVEDEQALYVHRSGVPYLHAVLQTYIGAGRLFYGNLDDVDLFKIHKASGKLTLLIYDDFEGSDEPILQTRIKVSFRKRQIDFYDHRSGGQRLVEKQRYMPAADRLE